MKQIQPVSTWQNGEIVIAELINAYAISDNLKDSATFHYQIMKIDASLITEGVVIMSGEDYDGYNDNEYAYNWIAKKLNLVIIN